MKATAFFLFWIFAVWTAPSAAQEIKGLAAGGPYPALTDKLALFGQFVGNWECEVTAINPDGSKQPPNRCEWNWGWILEGRATQDVFIIFSSDAKPGTPPVEYGTGVRAYDPKIDAWHVFYVGPVRSTLGFFTARKVGDEIVLQSALPAPGQNTGEEIGQWVFSEITKNSFRWRAQGSADGGKTWHIFQEIRARRVRSTP